MLKVMRWFQVTTAANTAATDAPTIERWSTRRWQRAMLSTHGLPILRQVFMNAKYACDAGSAGDDQHGALTACLLIWRAVVSSDQQQQQVATAWVDLGAVAALILNTTPHKHSSVSVRQLQLAMDIVRAVERASGSGGGPVLDLNQRTRACRSYHAHMSRF